MTLSLKLKWRGSRKSKKELDKLHRRAPEAVMGAVVREGHEVLRRSNENINSFRGTLVESGFVKRSGMSVEIGYAARHALAIHEGLPPNYIFPPWDGGLQDWSEAHGLVPFLVARAIWDKGIQPPRKFLARAINERQTGMATRIANRARRSL